MTATMTENLNQTNQFCFTDLEEMEYLAYWLEAESLRVAEDDEAKARRFHDLSQMVMTSAHECWEAMDLKYDEVKLIEDVVAWRVERESVEEPWHDHDDLERAEALHKEARAVLSRF